MKSATIFVLVGLPGSGKSTWIKNNIKDNYVIISTDNIIEEIAISRNLTYSDVWQSSIKSATKQAENEFLKAVSENKSIVWDQTNMTKSKRQSILSRVPNSYYKVCVSFETPIDIIKDRLIKREKETGKHIPEHVLINMSKSYERPNLSEGFDDVIIRST